MKYKITVRNQSSFSGAVFLFWNYEEGERALVWQASGIRPGLISRFTWQNDLELAWCETQIFGQQEEVTAYQTLPITSTHDRCALLSKKQGAYCLTSVEESVPEGHARIKADASVVSGSVYAGMGMNGFPTLVVSASPGFLYDFPLKISLWICCADQVVARQGAMIPSPKLLNLVMGIPAEIRFPSGVEKMEAVFQEDHSWLIKPDFS